MKIGEALLSIRKQDLVLPEFQREYVWSKEQAKQLLLSLYRGYPVVLRDSHKKAAVTLGKVLHGA